MHIKIWSDIRCPFCYIGKKHFESALKQFPNSDEITIEWKSFELDPNLKTATDKNAIEHFVESKGIDPERAKHMFNNVTAMASQAGLDFNLEASVPANTLKAHRLLHFAKNQGLGDQTKEVLLKAHLSEGKNVDDVNTLTSLASGLGMDAEKAKTMLDSDDFTYEVRKDQMEARNLGINSVPFFVIDNQYGISGAQPVEVFTESLEKAWKNKQGKLEMVPEGHSCDIDGHCN
ncbi:DsbA family oxidoreductase [Tamlana crocina]